MIWKKSLGQHFLHDENICKKIFTCVQSKTPERLLEIGSGYGAITKHLQTIGSQLVCIELDNQKISFLQNKIKNDNTIFIHADILKCQQPFNKPFSVVGNLPYNISSQIIFKLLCWYPFIDDIFIMVQKEVAERLCSYPQKKSYGFISVLLEAFFERKILFDIQPKSFTPAPNVMSSFIHLSSKKDVSFFNSYHNFKQFLKTSFAMKRKTLKNNLNKTFDISKLNIDILSKRPEELTLAEFKSLYNQIKNN